ncbi:MAG: hypothetical protein HOW73_31325 [Polyangiaceae bacterium]|nr:hypothetical protein [Polyangiaceae bacterium]
MARNADDVETYLLNLGRTFEKREVNGSSATFLITSPDTPVMAIRVAPPIVAINVNIGPTPTDEGHQLRFFRKLLELNASDLMHASYGLENGSIVLSAALALDNLDANELEATLSDIDVAIVRHTKELAQIARDGS